jgi:lipopolysaccharide biosynthesis glycosyltransferase
LSGSKKQPNDIVLAHFSERIKPWNSFFSHYFAFAYFHYLAMSPYRDKYTFRMRIRHLISNMLRCNFVKFAVKNLLKAKRLLKGL